jgi:hypothetical protein
MISPFDGIFPLIDVSDLLTRAKMYSDGSDTQRIIRALEDRYPVCVGQCKFTPGYTDVKLLDYIMDVVLDYARYKAPALFRAMMFERYMAGGMDAETAHHFISGELTALERGNFYSNGGRKWQ